MEIFLKTAKSCRPWQRQSCQTKLAPSHVVEKNLRGIITIDLEGRLLHEFHQDVSAQTTHKIQNVY